jgi:hypothetical protein
MISPAGGTRLGMAEMAMRKVRWELMRRRQRGVCFVVHLVLGDKHSRLTSLLPAGGGI